MFFFPDDSASKKDGWISGVALVSAHGSSEDRSRDLVTCGSAQSAFCQRRPRGDAELSMRRSHTILSWMPED